MGKLHLEAFMRMRTLSYLTGIAVLLTGCVVTSVCPYYTQKEVVKEPAIAGTWINQKNNQETWRFEPNLDGSYRLTMIEANKATILLAQPFKLDDQLLLDLGSLEQDIHVIPAHYLLKITQLRPTLQMSEISHEWLKNLLDQDPKALRHHLVAIGDQSDGRVVLTGDTAELQAFVRQHMTYGPAWKPTFDLKPAVRTNVVARAETDR